MTTDSEDHPAYDPRPANGQVPPWVPLSKDGVDLTQVYALLELTPTERAALLGRIATRMIKMKANAKVLDP